MNKIKSAIPSFVTSLNIVCGVCASVLALQGETKIAVLLIICAAVFDFCDGFVARLLNSVSEFGKQMDSLSDLISFGFAPSVILYEFAVSNGIFSHYVALFILLIAVFSALRLAKFNIDPEQTSEFKGLPTPASALFVISVCYYCKTSESALAGALTSKAAVIAVVAFVCVMMVVNLRLFSMKIKSLKIKSILWQLILAVSLVVLVIIFGVIGIAFTMILYVILSIIRNIVDKPAKPLARQESGKSEKYNGKPRRKGKYYHKRKSQRTDASNVAISQSKTDAGQVNVHAGMQPKRQNDEQPKSPGAQQPNSQNAKRHHHRRRKPQAKKENEQLNNKKQ